MSTFCRSGPKLVSSLPVVLDRYGKDTLVVSRVLRRTRDSIGVEICAVRETGFMRKFGWSTR